MQTARFWWIALGFFTGLKVWIFAFGLPAFFALWTMMFFNYVQHVHTDPWSAHNHSRSFTGCPTSLPSGTRQCASIHRMLRSPREAFVLLTRDHTMLICEGSLFP